MTDNTSQLTKFNPIIIALHWLMLLLIVAVYLFVEFRGLFPRGSEPRELMKTLHFMLGISVFFLVLLRLVVRFSTKAPDIIPAPKFIEVLLAKLMHIALYIFMIGMPLLGWLILNANGKAVPFWVCNYLCSFLKTKTWVSCYVKSMKLVAVLVISF
jgi:cytochrome b561